MVGESFGVGLWAVIVVESPACHQNSLAQIRRLQAESDAHDLVGRQTRSACELPVRDEGVRGLRDLVRHSLV